MDIEKGLNSLNDIKPPLYLHKRVMRSLWFLKMRRPLVLVSIALVGSSLYSISEGGRAFIEAETVGLLKELASITGYGFDFLAYASQLILIDIPYHVILTTVFSLFCLSYVRLLLTKSTYYQ